MHSVATILITILHVHLGVSSLEYMDVVTALQQACPYTNFCNKNASSYIQDGRQVPCCRECSCLDDCWKRNNCCPDKKHVSNGGERPSEIETCKDTIVKKGFVGLNHDRRRYFVTEICPDTVHDVALKQKCAGTEAETFADLIWVSDLETNKIYTNKFCAECHGIRKYKRWDISTSCVEFVLNNNHTQNIRSYPDSCSLSVTPPNRKAYKNQCLTPDISTCNVTGLWQTEDNVTESLCESHPLMFVKDTVATKIVFRNVFCFKCNSPPEELMEDICAISDVDGTRTFASFTTVLDIYEADEDLIKKRRCEMDEVEDPFKHTCLKLFCPVSQFPRYGSCQSRYSDTYFLVIGITFRLRTNFGRLKYGTRNGVDYSDIDLGVAIQRRIYQALGLEQCGRCIGEFYKSDVNEEVGKANLSLFFDFRPLIYTRGSKCSEEVIVPAMSKIIGDTLILNLEENEFVTFDIEEVENVPGTIRKNMSILNLPATKEDDKFCTARVYLNYKDLIKCPMVRLDGTYYPSLMRKADTAVKSRLVNTLFAVDGGPEKLQAGLNTTTSVCWEAYKTLVPRVTSLSLKHTSNTFCSTLITFVTILLNQ